MIDGITARVVGLPDRNVTSRPQVLPLFPESGGRLTVTLGLPSGFPAGRHPMTVEVWSRQANTGPQYVNVDLVVPTAPGSRDSPAGTGQGPPHRRYVLTVNNRGNIRSGRRPAGGDPERPSRSRWSRHG